MKSKSNIFNEHVMAGPERAQHEVTETEKRRMNVIERTGFSVRHR